MRTPSTFATALGLASALAFIALTPIGCKDELAAIDDAGADDAGHDARVDAGLPVLPFAGANLPSPFFFTSAADISIAGNCVIDTDMGTSSCWDDTVAFQSRSQYAPEAGAVALPELAIFSMGSLTISQDAQVRVQGARALVIVTRKDMTISGTVDVSAIDTAAGPGGYSGEKNSNSAGRGFGPGGAPDGVGHQGAGGGSLCGAGGNNKTGGKPAFLATVMPPVLGGSSGGSGFASGGGGGGAIELVCGGILTLNKQALVRANGGGAAFGGGGGGAGGEILVDTLAMNEFGSFVANGGGGGANTSSGDPTVAQGAPGSDNATPAPGGKGQNAGGSGTGGAASLGADGVYDAPMPAPTLGDYGGGGGGGAGLIHVRFRSGASVSGTPSPNASPCYVREPTK